MANAREELMRSMTEDQADMILRLRDHETAQKLYALADQEDRTDAHKARAEGIRVAGEHIDPETQDQSK